METEQLEMAKQERIIAKEQNMLDALKHSGATDNDTLFQNNIICLEDEIGWLSCVIHARLKEYTEGMAGFTERSVTDIHPLIQFPESSYSDFITQHELTYIDRLLLILAFAAEYSPKSLEQFEQKRSDTSYRGYGGIINQATGQFYPTLQTALFLLGGLNFQKTAYYKIMLTERYHLFKKQIVTLHYAGDNNYIQTDPRLVLEPAYQEYFITGKEPCLDHGTNFPADLLETDKTFDDLIVKESILQDLTDIKNYVDCHETLFTNDDAKRKLSPGYVAMFYGPPGTGKSLSAALLGKHCNVPVYKIDLSRVISKYIGETEKNLERVFSRLEGKNCILFFDEADALFGKRTEVTDAKDRYANQEVSYLLQRLEKWNGVVILATNFRQNLDEAFKRRIIKHVAFKPPGKDELMKLWTGHLPEGFTFEEDDMVDLLSSLYPFTGANIASVIKKASVRAISQNSSVLTVDMLNPVIQEECLQNDLMQFYKPIVRC